MPDCEEGLYDLFDDIAEVFEVLWGYPPENRYKWEAMTVEDARAELADLEDRLRKKVARELAEREAEAAQLAEATSNTPLTHQPFAALGALKLED